MMDATYVHVLSMTTALFFFKIVNAMRTQTDFYYLNTILFQLNWMKICVSL